MMRNMGTELLGVRKDRPYSYLLGCNEWATEERAIYMQSSGIEVGPVHYNIS